MAAINWVRWRFDEEVLSPADAKPISSNDYVFMVQSQSGVITQQDQLDIVTALNASIPVHLKNLFGDSVELVYDSFINRIYSAEEKKNLESKLSAVNLATYQNGLNQVAAWCKNAHKDGMKLKLRVPLLVMWDDALISYLIVASMRWEAAPALETEFKKLAVSEQESKKTELG